MRMDVSLVIRQCYLHSGHENKELITSGPVLRWSNTSPFKAEFSLAGCRRKWRRLEAQTNLMHCCCPQDERECGQPPAVSSKKTILSQQGTEVQEWVWKRFFFHSLQTRTQLYWHFNFSLDALSRALGSYRSRQMTCRTLNWKISVVSSKKVYGNLWCSDGKWIQ